MIILMIYPFLFSRLNFSIGYKFNIFAGIVESIHGSKIMQTSPNKQICHAFAVLFAIAVLLSCLQAPVSAQEKPEHSFDTEIRHIRNNAIPEFRHTYDDYIQYAPGVLAVGLKAAGYESRSSWGRMAVSDAFSAGIMAIAVNGLKYSVRRMRPDGTSRNSFPSGHTATAFMMATILHKEYGWRSPWFSIGGYTVAAATGISRVMNNRHWTTDVVAGATVGILSVQLGYFLADMIFKDRYLSERYERIPVAFDLQHRYYDIGLYFSKKFVLNRKGQGMPESGSAAGIGVTVPISPRWGISARLGTDYISYQDIDRPNTYSALAGGRWNIRFAKILEAEAKAMAGCAWMHGSCGFDFCTGASLALLTGCNFKIKAFAEYEISGPDRQKPSVHSINTGFSAGFCW